MLLDPDEYVDFVDHMTIDGLDVVDGAFSGVRLFVDMNLFSHESWRRYPEVFQSMLDFEIFKVQVDPTGLAFRDKYPRKWAAILHRGHVEEDLFASSISAGAFFQER